MDSIAIGVDLGGTKIAFAAADRDGHILATHTEPTLPDEGVEAVIGRIITGIDQVRGDHPVVGVGLDAPGAVVDGVVINAVNLGWRKVPLVDLVRAKLSLNVPAWAANDVNALTFGEMVFGAARGVRDFVYLAVGTGLGGGAVSGGRLINGVNGFAMELGHMSIDPNGRLCACGNHGCVEMYLAGKGLLISANQYLPDYPASVLRQQEPITTHAILDAARAGDPLALRVLDQAADALGQALAWSVMVLNPSLVVLGGGLGHAAGDLLFEPATAAMRARLIPELRPLIRVEVSQVESSALGAAALAWHELDEGDG